jgi:DNA replication licensing factor MCM2
VVTRRTGVFPQLLAVAYDCVTCGTTFGPVPARGGEARPDICFGCNGRGPFRINNVKTEYGNFQNLILQETPGTVPPGRVPRSKDIILLGDLIDIARPGEDVEVTGIYTHAQHQGAIGKKLSGFPVFNTVIEANSIQKKSGGSNAEWSEEDKKKIVHLSKDPRVRHPTSPNAPPSTHLVVYRLVRGSSSPWLLLSTVIAM